MLFTIDAPVYSTIAAVCAMFLSISDLLPMAAGLLADRRSWVAMGPFDFRPWSGAVQEGHEALVAEAEVFQAEVFQADEVAAVATAFGPVTTLFNQAGILIVKPLLEASQAGWDGLTTLQTRKARC